MELCRVNRCDCFSAAAALRPHVIMGACSPGTDKFEPKTVLKHFKNICEIPHISGHEQALCSYIKDFARKCGHEYFEDETGNLIVYVKASPGCEGVPPFLMQAHMDIWFRQRKKRQTMIF